MDNVNKKEKETDVVKDEVLDKKEIISDDEIKNIFLEYIAMLDKKLQNIENFLKEKSQEQKNQKEIKERLEQAKIFFDSFFAEHDEKNPYVRILFLEVLDILNDRGEKEIDYVEVLKLARERFYLEMKKVLEEWKSEDILEILGDQKLAEINEFIMSKKKNVIEKPQYFSNDVLSISDRNGRSNLLLK